MKPSSIGALLALPLVLCLLPGRGEAQRRYKVTVDSVPQGATLYLEDKEAGAQGQTPHTFTLKAGSYTFLLEAEGYQSLTRTVKVTKASTFTFTMNKKPDPASVTIDAAAGATDVKGATVKVNGKETGKVPLTLRLQPGRYLVEVVRDGYETWSEWMDITGTEKRTVVVSLVRSAAGTGSLLVSSNIVGAEVFVDGKRVDTAPALVEKLGPGKVRVEVRAKGYLMKQQEVTVEAGKTTKVTIELQPDGQTVAASTGTLQVLANEKEVEIVVDGTPRGKAPVKVEGLAEGTHVVEGKRSGFTTAEQTISVSKGKLTTIKLHLKPVEPTKRTGALRVVANVLGAEVFLDGALVGKTPLLRHQIDPGPHFVRLRAPGREETEQMVEVKAGQIVEVRTALKPIGTLGAATPAGGTPTVARGARPAPRETPTGMASFSGHLVETGSFAADLSLGFAHLFEGRLTAGIFSRTHLGLDGGIEFRTYGAVSEVGLHTKLRVLRKSLFALAMLCSFGGGGGPSSRNTAYANIGTVGSLWFKQLVTFSARAYFSFYTDRLCAATPGGSEVRACTVPQSDFSPASRIRERHGGARFFLSAILEVPLGRRVNLFALLEGAPGQGNRYSYTDRFAEYMPESDPALYFRLGATLKY